MGCSKGRIKNPVGCGRFAVVCIARLTAEALDPAVGHTSSDVAGVARLASMKRFECGSGLSFDRAASNNYTRRV